MVIVLTCWFSVCKRFFSLCSLNDVSPTCVLNDTGSTEGFSFHDHSTEMSLLRLLQEKPTSLFRSSDHMKINVSINPIFNCQTLNTLLWWRKPNILFSLAKYVKRKLNALLGQQKKDVSLGLPIPMWGLEIPEFDFQPTGI